MNRILIAAVALVTVAGFAATAEAGQDAHKRATSPQAVHSVPKPAATRATEGRNVAISQGREAYIDRAEEMNARVDN